MKKYIILKETRIDFSSSEYDGYGSESHYIFARINEYEYFQSEEEALTKINKIKKKGDVFEIKKVIID